MKRTDIRSIFSAKVAELLNQGYTIYPDSMRGHQGEIAKVDLSRGSEIIRVMLERTSDYETGWHESIIRLTVGRAQQDGNTILGHWDDTLWNRRLDIIETHTWAEVGERHRHGDRIIDGDWYTPIDEARRIWETRMARYRNTSTPPTECSDAMKSAALRYLKKQPIRGMKSKKVSDIATMRKTTKNGQTHYQIRMKNTGNFYTIALA